MQNGTRFKYGDILIHLKKLSYLRINTMLYDHCMTHESRTQNAMVSHSGINILLILFQSHHKSLSYDYNRNIPTFYLGAPIFHTN